MTNVYTRKSRCPRTVTLLDFRTFGNRDVRRLRILSPTRRSNPHPIGIIPQNVLNTSRHVIWHPDNFKISETYRDKVHHTRLQNFTCKHPESFKPKRHLPDIRYIENTTYRERYVHPSRLQDLAPDYSTTKIVGIPDKKAAKGIVPDLIVAEYLPVIERGITIPV